MRPAILRLILTITLCTVFSLASAWAGGTPDGFGGKRIRVCHPHMFEDVCQSMLTEEAVESGTIPPLNKRLPSELRHIELKKPGSYGGSITVLTNSLRTSSFLRNSTQRLIELDAASKSFVANVASGYRHLGIGLIEVTLREGHRWSDGKPFTADDVVFSEAAERHHGTSGHDLTFVKKDQWTLHVSCSCSNSELLLEIANLQLYPQHTSREHDNPWFPSVSQELEAIEFPTLRPWILESIHRGLYTYRRNYFFHAIDASKNQLPYLDRLLFEEMGLDARMLRLSLASSDDDTIIQASIPLSKYDRVESDAKRLGYRIDKQDQGLGNFLSFAFNYTHEDPLLRELFLNSEFRRAMSSGIDRQEIVNALSGLVEPWVLPVTHMWTEISDVVEPIQSRNARRLMLDVDGMSEGADGGLVYEGQPLVLEMVVWARSSEARDIAEMVVDMWNRIGVTVNLHIEESPQEFCRLTKSGLHHVAGASLNFQEFARAVEYPFYITAPFYTVACPLGALGWATYWRRPMSGDPPDGFPRDLFEAAERWTRVDRWEQAQEPLTAEYRDAARELAQQSAEGLYTIGTVTWPPRLLVRSQRLVTNGNISSGAWAAAR